MPVSFHLGNKLDFVSVVLSSPLTFNINKEVSKRASYVVCTK